jgi:hypothetical protein
VNPGDAFNGADAGLGTDFVRGEIANSRLKFKLDDDLKSRIEELLKPEYRSYGSVERQLLGLSVVKTNRFYIYPSVGPRSISCQFPESMFEKAQAYGQGDRRF